MTMYEYLKNDQEPIPTWLLEIKEGGKFSRDDFFSSRIVFYPGSYTDGHAVKDLLFEHYLNGYCLGNG